MFECINFTYVFTRFFFDENCQEYLVKMKNEAATSKNVQTNCAFLTPLLLLLVAWDQTWPLGTMPLHDFSNWSEDKLTHTHIPYAHLQDASAWKSIKETKKSQEFQIGIQWVRNLINNLSR